MNISIVVATHVPFWIPPDSVYFPIHVGAVGKRSIGYVQDDLGDNISDKNPMFCELTALYWAWKHNTTDDAIGLCRFRRYFGKTNARGANAILNKTDFEKLLTEYECIVPRKRHVSEEGLRDAYAKAHRVEDLEILDTYIREHAPAYVEAFDRVMAAKEIYSHNMFVLPRALFEEYCEFLFTTLFAMEARIDVTNYTEKEKRVFSYMGEILFNVWFEKRQPKVHETVMLYLVKASWQQRLLHSLKKLWR